MRLFVTIAHYFKQQPSDSWHQALGSGRDPLPRIAALNSEIVALHRYFGPYRATLDARLRRHDTSDVNVLDIVIMTARGCNVLESIGVDPSTYSVEYFDGPPLMLAFEAQRIMRERAGSYDLYAYLEDDLTIVDPHFFDKILWFVESFGPDVMLTPTRYEMAHSGLPAKIEFSPGLSSKLLSHFRQRTLVPKLTGIWNDREQTFRLPYNPHSACFFVTDEQLRRWIAQPSFYDRDASFAIRSSAPPPMHRAAHSACTGRRSRTRGSCRLNIMARATLHPLRQRARAMVRRHSCGWPSNRSNPARHIPFQRSASIRSIR